MSDTFDYIIVGGGTAGFVLASRLSAALPDLQILFVEAGGAGDPRIEPSQGYHAGTDPTTNIEWQHLTVPQKGFDGKVVSQVQGKVLGGSSAINVQGWTRGAAVDFDQWADVLNDKKWSWSGLLPYFKRSETFYPSKNKTGIDYSKNHGFDGPVKVRDVFASTCPTSALTYKLVEVVQLLMPKGQVSQSTNSGKPRNFPLSKMVSQAYESVGLKWNPDKDSGDMLGYCEASANTYEGKRQYAANSYQLQSNVTIWTDTLAENIIFEGKRAIGVQISRSESARTPEATRVMARKEVLVCSGVQGSAKLLLLSGIGPIEELQRHSVSQICDLPVGENYSDHPFFHTFWKVRDRGLSLGDMPFITPECDWTAGIPVDVMAWHRNDDVIATLGEKTLDRTKLEMLKAEGKPHTESFALYGHVDLSGCGEPNPGGSVLQMCNVLVSPTSRGTLKLQSSDPKDAPLLDPNMLSNELDTRLLYSCGRLTIAAMQSPAAQEYGTQEYGIKESMRGDTSDYAMRARMLKTARSLNHGSGTCAMGSVVDTECRVKGIQNLRVIDASVFPMPIGAHYQAAVYAVAEQMAQIIIDGLQKS